MTDERKSARIGLGMTSAQKQTLERWAKKLRPYQPVSNTLLEILFLRGTGSSWEFLAVPSSSSQELGVPRSLKGRARTSEIREDLNPDVKDLKTNTEEVSRTPQAPLDLCERIVGHLNIVAGTTFRFRAKKTRDAIQARLSDGFEEADFKRAIDNQWKAWSGTEFQKFMRPETLFGPKFDGYQGAKGNPLPFDKNAVHPEVRRRIEHNQEQMRQLREKAAHGDPQATRTLELVLHGNSRSSGITVGDDEDVPFD